MKKPLLFTLLLLLAAFACATSYTIGTGTSSTSYSPFYGLYDYGWNKIIYTAAEINTAGLTGPANLYGFGFYAYNTPANHILLDQKVYLRHTALANYGTATDETGTGYPAPAGFTQVYSADVVYNGLGWYYLTFSSPFAWDGTSNIEILYENWDGDYYSGYPTHTYTSTSTNYMTVYKYADTTFPTTVGTRSYNRPNFRLLTQPLDAPVAATLVAPADGAWAFNDVSLIWNNGQGMASSYDLYLGTASDPPLLTNTTDMVYAPTVSAGTTYYWKVVAKNVDGTAAASAIRSFTTAGANQLAESFENTTFPPTGWTNPGAFTRSTTTPYHLTAGAYKSTAAAAMLYTPMLELTATSELNFMARAGASTGIGRIQIKYSADGTTWTAIGGEIAMPANSNWNNYVVDLSSLAGENYMIGFENYSSTTTAAAIYIDYVFGPDFAALTPDPATVIYPADAGYAFLDGTLQWNPAASGGIPSSYDVYFGTTNPPDYVTNQAELTYTPTLAAATTYYWQIVPRNGTGPAVNCPVWSFATPGATQLAESFEVVTPFLPVGWDNPGTWSGTTTSPFHGARVAYKSASTTPAILSTPLLGIETGDALDFYYRTASTTGYGLMNIKYSSDRVTWSQIGATISMPITTTWNHAVVDLSAIAGNNYFLAFEVFTSTSTSSIYIDHVFGPDFAAVAPGAPTLTAPADLATDVSEYTTFSWTAPTTGGIPTGYNLYLDTVSGSTLYASDVTSPYTLTTALNYNTPYYWTVAAYNGSGTGPGATVQSFTTRPDPIIYTMPWLEDFGTTGTTFPPTNWTRWSGLLTTEPVTLTTTTSGWLQDDFANIVTDPTNKSAKTNIYGTTWKYWLMTPPIQMPGAGYQLEFDIALTDYTNALPPDDPAGLSGVDDKFVVLISDGTSWSTANAVKVWDNDDLTTGGIYEVYNSVSHTGDHYVIPLDGYTGIKYIAFYGESTVSNADNDFFVDNVRIRLAGQAPDHVTLLTPEDQSTSVDPGNCILNWQNAVGGGEPGWYEIYVGTDLIDPGNDYYGEYLYETTNSNLDLSAQTDIDLGFNTTWYWAVLPYNDDGNPDPTSGLQVFRFTTLPDPTIVALPHEEYFDSVTAPDMAYGWTGYVNSTSTSAYVRTYSSTTYAQSPPNSVQMSNSADAAADLRLITPMIDLGRSLSQIKLKFYASSSSTGYPLLVGTVDVPDGTGTFNQIASISLTSTKTEYEVSYADYTGTDQYICFMHGLGGTYRSLYIDDVRLLELLPNDLAATAVSNPGIMTAGTAYDFTVDVYNEGTATQSAYTVKLMSVDARTELATLDVTTPLDPGASAQHILSWTPATGGVYEVYGKVVLTGDQNATNDDSPTTELYVLDNTMTVIPVGDDATTTSSTMLPVDMYYRNSVTEELYFTDEMHLQSGNITALVYKNTFLNERPDKAIKIWMAHTTVTDLSGGWLPTLDYTLVFDGTVDFPSGVNYVVIPLDTPFAYTGGTLATRFYRVFDSGALSSSDKFYYTTNPAHTVRSRYLRSDSTTYDPLAPSAAGTTLGYFPNTTFVVQNAVMQAGAVLNGYVYEAGGTTPVAGATVTIEDVRYSTTTDENGYYEFRFWEAHTVDAAVAKFGYYGATQASISLPLGTPVTQDFYLTPLPQASVSGTVTANDYPAGLEGATVSLFGYDDYEVQTGTGGAFSIADVYGNSAGEIYSVTVEKDGYTSYIGTLTVYESAVTGLSYNLVEYLWTPYNLVASHEGADARLNWDPAGLPDYQFYDFEADNGGFTHVDNPTPGWEWGTSSYSGAHSGTKVWGTVLEGNYANSAVYDLISPPSNLIPAGAFLTFWHFYRFEFYTTPSYYDGGIVQISTDGGTNWTTITPVGGYPCTSTSGLGSIQMYGGEQLTWTQANFDLSAYTNQTVMFKWKMLSESSVSREGWFVDDVFIGIPIAKTALQRFGASNDDRWFLNYDVYRFLAADEGTPGNWTQLDDDWADVTFLDTGFAALGEGSYKWAVKANYSGALESEAIISNALGIFITPPDVENGTIGATGNNVTIAWPAEPGASYYTVYGSNDPYAPDPWAILGYSATPSFTFDAGATAYKFFKITASDGEMPASKGVWPQLNK